MPVQILSWYFSFYYSAALIQFHIILLSDSSHDIKHTIIPAWSTSDS